MTYFGCEELAPEAMIVDLMAVWRRQVWTERSELSANDANGSTISARQGGRDWIVNRVNLERDNKQRQLMHVVRDVPEAVERYLPSRLGRSRRLCFWDTSSSVVDSCLASAILDHMIIHI